MREEKVIFKNQLHFNIFPLRERTRFFFLLILFHWHRTREITRFEFEHVRQFLSFFILLYHVLILTLSLFSFTFLFVVFLSFPVFHASAHTHNPSQCSCSCCYINVHFIIDESEFNFTASKKKIKLSMPRLIDSLHLILSSSFFLCCLPSFVHFCMCFVLLSGLYRIYHHRRQYYTHNIAANRYTLFASCSSSIAQSIHHAMPHIHTSYL